MELGSQNQQIRDAANKSRPMTELLSNVDAELGVAATAALLVAGAARSDEADPPKPTSWEHGEEPQQPIERAF